MKIKYLKFKNWLLMSVMGLFGLTACHSSKEAAQNQVKNDEPAPEVKPRGEMALMYGVPTMNFVVKGKVVNTEGKPVKGMQVVLVNQNVDITPDFLQEDNPYVQEYLRKASDTTDAQGAFQCNVSDVPVEVQRVMVRDIDGDKNGSYEDQMLEVKFTQDDQTVEGQGWNRGTRTKELDITVNKK